MATSQPRTPGNSKRFSWDLWYHCLPYQLGRAKGLDADSNRGDLVSRWFTGLGRQVLWGTLFTVFVVPAALGSLVLWRQYRLEVKASRSAEETLALFRSGLVAEVEAAMRLGQMEGVRRAVEHIGGMKGVRVISLTDRNGVVVVSTSKGRQFSLLDDAPFRAALASKREVILHEATSDAVLYRVAIPLLNKAECQGCHGKAQAVNGVLLADLTVLDIRRAFRAQLLAMLGLFLASGLAVTAIVYAGVRQGVIMPVKKLLEGARRVAGGDLSQRIEVHAGSEIGELAEGFNRMVSDLERHVGALERTTREREESKRLAEIGEMAAQVAHQVRNPLNTIEGAAYYLKSVRPDDPEVPEYADLIAEQVGRLNTVASELLQAARPRPTFFEPVDVNTLVRTTGEKIKTQRRDKAVDVDYRLTDALAPVLLDRRQLTEVLENLLENAWDAIEGSGRITIETAEDHLGQLKPYLRLVVADTGVGIAPEDQAKLFKPFHSTKPSGTGLGLVVVKRIIETHRGEIEVSSQRGHGTRVTVRLPIER
jgi:signal transduction histidine kinase